MKSIFIALVACLLLSSSFSGTTASKQSQSSNIKQRYSTIGDTVWAASFRSITQSFRPKFRQIELINQKIYSS